MDTPTFVLGVPSTYSKMADSKFFLFDFGPLKMERGGGKVKLIMKWPHIRKIHTAIAPYATYTLRFVFMC